jgi:hypothetical protein
VNVLLIYGYSVLTGDGYGWWAYADLPKYKVRELDRFLNESNITRYDDAFCLSNGTDSNLITFLRIYSYYMEGPITMLVDHKAGTAKMNDTWIIWPWAGHIS